jgi:hypothetical protein
MIRFVLSGFDRLRFRGDSRMLNNERGVDSYLYGQNIRYVDFPKHCERLTKTLCEQTEKSAKEQGVPLRYLNSPATDKEAIARQLITANPHASGRLIVLSCVEACSTYRLRKNSEGMVKPVKEPAKCVHYYHYFQHAQLGLCYARVQSWFPFTVRVGMNGRQWLYQQLRNRAVNFQRDGNLLVSVDDTALAQQILDEQVHAGYAKLLGDLVRPIQPLWEYLHSQVHMPYYWMAEQTEWASDFMFHSAADLALWYPRWLRHGLITLSCEDVMRYLGKKYPKNCEGEVKIDLRAREEGTRLKFWYEANSMKCYDKGSTALRAFRVETTINQPKWFRVFRTKEGEERGTPKWLEMRKGVADMDRRAEVSQAANNRLMESFATVAETQTLGELLKPLGQPVIKDGVRRARALNPLTGKDGVLLRALGKGEYLIQGFRNADLRKEIHGEMTDDKERRCQSAAMTRQLALLREHGLIVRVGKTHRYQLSSNGRRIVTAVLTAQASDISRLSGNT